MLEEFLAYMSAQGWSIERNKTPVKDLPEPVRNRYRSLPKEWLEFLAEVRSMVSSGEDAWFLCAEDYEPQENQAFQWNEWEQISLEAAESDRALVRKVTRFWNEHLPIFMSVKNGYAYYALSMADGSVVGGCEPEFEESVPAAGSYEEFMRRIMEGQIRL